MSRTRPFCFDTHTVRKGDQGLITVARFHCAKCARFLDLTLGEGAPRQANALAKRASREGWQTDAMTRNKTLCPECLKAKPNQDTDSELRSAPMAASPIPLRPTPQSIQAKATPDQRLKIRAALDEHFDDASGRYLGSMTDATIAEKLNVQRILVETIREAAYGPIRESPEISSIRSDVASFEERLETWEAAGRALRSQLAEITARLTNIGKTP